MTAEEIRLAVSAYIHDRLARDLATQRGAAAALARATHTSPAHVANVKNGKVAAGPEFARALADHWGLREAELEARAVAWFEERGRHPQASRHASVRWTEMDARYPNLAHAIAILREEGKIDPALLDEAEQTKLRSEGDLPVTEWWRMIENEAILRRRYRGSMQTPPARVDKQLTPQGLAAAQHIVAARRELGMPAEAEPIDVSTSASALAGAPNVDSSMMDSKKRRKH